MYLQCISSITFTTGANARIEENKAEGKGRGGGVAITGDKVGSVVNEKTITLETTFAGVINANSASKGSAIYVEMIKVKQDNDTNTPDEYAKLNFGEIIGTTSGTGDGFVYIKECEYLEISGTFRNNTAENGGALYVDNSTNISLGGTGKGGAPFSITGCNAINGGGIYLNKSTVTFQKGRIGAANVQAIDYYNTADQGGAVYVGSDSTFTMLEMSQRYASPIISFNSATNFGGGIFVEKGGTFIFKGGSINNNMAGKYGGAIFGQSNSNITLHCGTIEGNKMGYLDRNKNREQHDESEVYDKGNGYGVTRTVYTETSSYTELCMTPGIYSLGKVTVKQGGDASEFDKKPLTIDQQNSNDYKYIAIRASSFVYGGSGTTEENGVKKPTYPNKIIGDLWLGRMKPVYQNNLKGGDHYSKIAEHVKDGFDTNWMWDINGMYGFKSQYVNNYSLSYLKFWQVMHNVGGYPSGDLEWWDYVLVILAWELPARSGVKDVTYISCCLKDEPTDNDLNNGGKDASEPEALTNLGYYTSKMLPTDAYAGEGDWVAVRTDVWLFPNEFNHNNNKIREPGFSIWTTRKICDMHGDIQASKSYSKDDGRRANGVISMEDYARDYATWFDSNTIGSNPTDWLKAITSAIAIIAAEAGAVAGVVTPGGFITKGIAILTTIAAITCRVEILRSDIEKLYKDSMKYPKYKISKLETAIDANGNIIYEDVLDDDGNPTGKQQPKKIYVDYWRYYPQGGDERID